jgi:hypothetical protein
MAAFGEPNNVPASSTPTQMQQNSDDLRGPGGSGPSDFHKSMGRARDPLSGDNYVDVISNYPTRDGYDQAAQGIAPQVSASDVAAMRAVLRDAGFDEEECRAIIHEYLTGRANAQDENIGGPESFAGMPERGGGMAGDAAADDFDKMHPKAWPILMGGRSSDYDRMHERIRENNQHKQRTLASKLAQDTKIAEGAFLERLAVRRPYCLDTLDKVKRFACCMANQQVRSPHGRPVEIANDGATGPYDAAKMRESAQLTATREEFEDFIKHGGKPIKWI